MRISGPESRGMFERYDITDERDIQIAGSKASTAPGGKKRKELQKNDSPGRRHITKIAGSAKSIA